MSAIKYLLLGPASLLGVCLLNACSPGPAEQAWFPLRAGEVTRYDVHYDQEIGRDDEVWTLTTRGPVTWEGQSYMQRYHSQGVAYFLQSDAQGVRRLAHQTDLDRDPQLDATPLWVLKAPYLPGTEWSNPTVPYLLMRKNEHPRELKHSHKATMTWRIVFVTEQVKLASGESLGPCLHVHGQAFLNLYTDPVNGFSDVPLTSHEWYCRGEGLVKFTREEKVPPGFMAGGSLTAERKR